MFNLKNKKIKKFAFSLSFFIFFFTAHINANAQMEMLPVGGMDGLLGDESGGNLAINPSPRYPEPDQEVTMNLYDAAVGSRGVRWFVDGIEQTESQNQRSITINSGSLGQKTTVQALVETFIGETLNVSYEIKPIIIDIIIEADTTTPAFYKGRPLPGNGSEVKAIALVQTNSSGIIDNPNRYIYHWRLNRNTIGRGFGLEESVVNFSSQYRQSVSLHLSVRDQSTGQTVGEKTISVPFVEPKLYFYEFNPLRGLSENVLPNPLNLIGDEITLRAEPYYLSNSTMQQQDNVLKEWRINNQVVNTAESNPMEITLRREGGSGRFNIGFHIRNLSDIIQGVRDSITITF